MACVIVYHLIIWGMGLTGASGRVPHSFVYFSLRDQLASYQNSCLL